MSERKELLRDIACMKADRLRVYVDMAVELINQDFPDLPPFVAEELSRPTTDVDEMLFVVLMALSASPRFLRHIAINSTNYPMEKFLLHLNEQFDIYHQGLDANGDKCKTSNDVRYPTLRSFVLHISESIYTA